MRRRRLTNPHVSTRATKGKKHPESLLWKQGQENDPCRAGEAAATQP